MSWISTNNLRRFADKLFHGNLSFGGSVTHNGATTFNGGVKVNTTKAEFAAPVSFTGTTTYKGKEIATKADITTPDLTPYMKKEADSDLDMTDRRIFCGYTSIYSEGDFYIDTAGNSIQLLADGIFLNGSPLDTRANNKKLYAPKDSPTFTGTVTALNVIVSTSLTIPGGKIWIA